MFMIHKSLFIAAFFITSMPLFADTLVVGSVYFDSSQTLNEVIKLSAQHDNEGIARLIENGHVSNPTAAEMDIVVLITGSTPDSPAEFRLLNGPTTYWTMTKNVREFVKPVASSTPLPTPTPTPSPTPEATPAPSETATPAAKHYSRKHANGAPLDDDNGQRVWHQVDGKWKWYPVSKHHSPVKKALPPE
jgi:hypothetical protein